MQLILKLIFGIIILSWSSILIRWIGDVHPLIITFYRLAISSIVLFPFVIKSFKPTFHKSLKFKYHLLFAGFFLALHFYSWISSLQLTTVGNSIFLESTHPLFGWILSILILKEKASKTLLPALIMGLLGMYFTISINLFGSSNAFMGDMLAVFSAFCIAAYLIVARILRLEFDILSYLFVVYVVAAFFTFILIIVYGLNFWELSLTNWLLLIILAVGPNLIGHSVLNWASRYMPVYKVNMALLSESVLATVYAALLLDEIPLMEFYFGAVLIITAIVSIFLVRK